ncbi:thioredoxin domain-containing protein [Aquirufa ecclesiirivi]|uniref:thioredoxin domain-containing protein n=1 Tax=Aquirufa ecclesiirivi TaxID=2715124 RepID=UPI0023D84198|nr:thioredoxin domain-containing protein [Aquirufa ecclesiirivi]MDF0694822.1 thioredoxin domain-containing protein [Aquirufa ecclesiirivi]
MKAFLFSSLIALTIFSCSKPAENGLQDVAATEFQQAIQTNASNQVLDVRTPDEYAGGHIAGAISADISSGAFQQATESLDKNKAVFVYCLSGGRSSQAAQQLVDMGFKEVYNLGGGILAWNAANLPLSMEEGAANQQTGMTLATFETQIKGKKKVIIDYNATWCGPCKTLSPILEAYVKDQKGAVELIKIDVDANPELAKAKNIEAIPYLELYQDGKLTWKNVGLIGRAELNKL